MFTQFKYLFYDLASWKCGSLKDYFYALFEGGIWATILYRINRSVFLINIPIIKIILRLFCFFLFKITEAFFGVSLPPSVNFGPGLHIGHAGLIIINHEVNAGKNLTIAHGVTIGTKGLGKIGVPILGDNVFIGAGAKILGKIRIRDNARIGANAVVISDIPEGATAVGVPAKIIKK